MPIYDRYMNFVYYNDDPDACLASHRAIVAKINAGFKEYRMIRGERKSLVPGRFHALHRLLVNEFTPQDVFAAYCSALWYMLLEFWGKKINNLMYFIGLKLYSRITFTVLCMYNPYAGYTYARKWKLNYDSGPFYRKIEHLEDHYDEYTDLTITGIALEDDEAFELSNNWLQGIDCDESLENGTPWCRLLLSTSRDNMIDRSIKTGLSYKTYNAFNEYKSRVKVKRVKHCPICKRRTYMDRIGNQILCSCYKGERDKTWQTSFNKEHYKAIHSDVHQPAKAAKWFIKEEDAYEF